MIYLVHGWTGNIDYILKADGEVVDLTGATVTIVLRDKNKTSVTPSGTLTVVSASDGQVRFAPSATDVDSSKAPYFVRFRVVGADSRVTFHPNAEAEKWIVGT